MELDKLKQLLGISLEDVTKDTALQFTMEDVKEIILNYCNLDEVPAGLISTAYRMAVDLYRAENPGNEGTGLLITSISEGDTSTSFKGTEESIKGTLLKDYENQLNRFRKLVW